ncbi:hypothetical protein OBBRIDRAFT_833129 [Obba rivulosa]|uniref:Uncharacterized protein n=1 Tax=Obba rivulosa TaxID=1052685 RepID=A0A8E2B607_9APHY|nr:hypothetical protein OBBRIDRAFT_833129 [Obba rivulosa]
MGEDLDHSAVPTDPDMVWCTVECDTDANDRSDSQAELSQDIIVAWDASGDLPAEAANTEVIHTATNRSLQLQGEFAQDITKGKALSRLQFATPQDAFPTSITSTSKSGRDGLSDV